MGNRQKSRKQIKELHDDLARARLKLEMERHFRSSAENKLAKSIERVTIMEEELLPLLGIKTRACPECRILTGDDQRADAGRDPRNRFPQYKCRACGGVFHSGQWAIAFRKVLVETMKRVLADMMPKNGETFRFEQGPGDPFPVPMTATEIVMMEKRYKDYGEHYSNPFSEAGDPSKW